MLKRVLFAFMCAALIAAGMLPSVLAQGDNPLPAPTGPYQVGATFRQWIDDSREEPFTGDPNDKRILSAWIFYPADVVEGAERMPYVMGEAIVPMIRTFVIDFYGQDFDRTFAALSQWTSHAYRDAPVSDGAASYPVILFSVNTGFPLVHSLQAVELASHGYIVIEVLHSYGYSIEFTSTGIKTGDLEDTPMDWLMELCVIDNMAILDQLAVMNAPESEDSLAGSLDLNRIGITGNSIAGGVARETALRDSRITAGISQDGAFDPFAPTPLEQPFMYMFQELPTELYYQDSKVAAYRISFDGFRHGTFTDLIFWPGVQDHPAVLGRNITSERAHAVLTTYVVAFFDEYLKGEEQSLLDGKSEDFPEAKTFESINAD